MLQKTAKLRIIYIDYLPPGSSHVYSPCLALVVVTSAPAQLIELRLVQYILLTCTLLTQGCKNIGTVGPQVLRKDSVQ